MFNYTSETRLKLAIGLSTVFLLIEATGGYFASSLAVLSDAAHLLSDIAGFALALVALIAAKTPSCKHYNYGLARAEVFGALASIISLWIVTIFLLYEAYHRAIAWCEGNAIEIDGKLMFFIALFGVFVNVILINLFHEEHGAGFGGGHDHSHGHGHSEGDVEEAVTEHGKLYTVV